MADSIADLVITSTMLLTEPTWAKTVGHRPLLGRERYAYDASAAHLHNIADTFANVMDCGFQFGDKSDEYDFLDFFCGRQGMRERFWFPMWPDSFELAVDIATTDATCTIRECGLDAIATTDLRIFLLLEDGSWIVRHVTDVTVAGDTEILTVETAFDRDIAIEDVKVFGRFLLGRFDIDELAMHYISSTVTECDARFVELTNEYTAEPVA